MTTIKLKNKPDYASRHNEQNEQKISVDFLGGSLKIINFRTTVLPNKAELTFMKKLMLLAMLIAVNAVAYAQSVTFTQLFNVFSGTAKSENVFSSASKQEVASTSANPAQRLESFKFNEGQANEATILTGQGMVKNSKELKPELTFLTKDSITVARLKTEITAAGFVLDAQKEVMGTKSFTYSKGKNSVWINVANNGACIVKLFKKP